METIAAVRTASENGPLMSEKDSGLQPLGLSIYREEKSNHEDDAAGNLNRDDCGNAVPGLA